MDRVHLYRASREGVLETDLWVDGLVILSRTYPHGESPERYAQAGDDSMAAIILNQGPRSALAVYVAELYYEGWRRTFEEAAQDCRRDWGFNPLWAPAETVVVTRQKRVALDEHIHFCFRCGHRVRHHVYAPSDDPAQAPVIFSCPGCGIQVTHLAVSWEEPDPSQATKG